MVLLPPPTYGGTVGILLRPPVTESRKRNFIDKVHKHRNYKQLTSLATISSRTIIKHCRLSAIIHHQTYHGS